MFPRAFAVPGEVERLKWVGLYPQRQGGDAFMMRIKVPGGVLTAPQAREIGIAAEAFAEGHRKKWRLNHTPLFLDFLEGKEQYECTPWGIPSYSIFGWQRPCYLMADGYAKTTRPALSSRKSPPSCSMSSPA